MKKIKNIIISLVLMFGLSTPLLATSAVSVTAQSKAAICEGVGLVGGTGCEQSPDQPSVDNTIKNVVNIMGLLVGIIAVIMIIIGGLKYITSGGDSGKVSSAKDTILYAVIGLVVVALSQVIVRFVLTKV